MSRDLINLAVAALPEGQDCTIESSLVGFGFSAPVRPEAEQQHCSCTSHPSFSPQSSSYHQQGDIPTQPALKDEIEDGKNPTPLILCHYSQSLGCFFFFFFNKDLFSSHKSVIPSFSRVLLVQCCTSACKLVHVPVHNHRGYSKRESEIFHVLRTGLRIAKQPEPGWCLHFPHPWTLLAKGNTSALFVLLRCI